jgi:hypothetical protein
MIVLLTIAAMAAPAFAEDRLSLNGQMRVRGWRLDNGQDVNTYADQRLRIGGKFSVAEGVSVTFRTDVTERTWGAGGSEFGSGRLPQDGQQWDRAHLDLTMDNVHLRAGQQLVTFGLGETMNSQDAGFRFDINGPVTISAFWMLDDQRNVAGTKAGFEIDQQTGVVVPRLATPDNDNADSYFFGANVGHKTDMYSGNFFVGGETKAISADEKAFLIGADFATKLNVVNLKAELDFFTGDATATADSMGTQAFVDASMAATDVITVGGQLYYALAAGNNEVQYQYIGNDFDGYDPIWDLGTSLSNEQMPLGRPFDFTGDNAGVIGGRLYANMKATDSVKVAASVAYLTPEDDNMTKGNSDIKSNLMVGGAVTYAVMANTSLQAQAQYTATDLHQGSTDDNFDIGVGLYVNF